MASSTFTSLAVARGQSGCWDCLDLTTCGDWGCLGKGDLWDGRAERRTLGHGPAHWVAPWAVSDASVYPGAG